MINCEHVIVQRVVSLFFRLYFNKLSETKIVEITYAITKTFQNTIVQGICHQSFKVTNHTNFISHNVLKTIM